MEPIAYTIKDASRVVGVGRTKLYEAIGSGQLPARKLGRRTLIMAADLEDWLAQLPPAKPGTRQNDAR